MESKNLMCVHVWRCCMIRTVSPGSPLSPLAPLVPGPPWSNNQTQNVHLQIQNVSTIKCNISLLPVPLEFTLKTPTLTDYKLNWSWHGGQCCPEPLSKAHSTAWVWISTSQAISHYMMVMYTSVNHWSIQDISSFSLLFLALILNLV